MFIQGISLIKVVQCILEALSESIYVVLLIPCQYSVAFPPNLHFYLFFFFHKYKLLPNNYLSVSFRPHFPLMIVVLGVFLKSLSAVMNPAFSSIAVE